MPSLLADFVEVLGRAVVDPAAAAAAAAASKMDTDDAVEGGVDDDGGVEAIPAPASLDRGALLYCERSLELLVDLLSQVVRVVGGG